MRKIKSKRKRLILLAGLLSLFFVSVVYATNFNQAITETLNFVSPTNFWFQSITDTFNFLSSTNYWYQTTSESLSFLSSPSLWYVNPIAKIGFCVNITATGFNNCGSTIAFSLTGAGAIQTITLSSCSVSPTSVIGNGNPVTVSTLPPSCQFTAHLPNGYLFTGNNQQNEFFTTSPQAVLSDTYYSGVSGTSQTVTVVVFQTVVINPPASSCTNSADCGANQLGIYIGLGVPSLIIMAVFIYIPYRLDIKDERIYIFMLMLAMTFIGFISNIGAFGNFGIVWYIVIFIDILGVLFIIQATRQHRDGSF